MNIQLFSTSLEQMEAPLLVVPVFADDKRLPEGLQFLAGELVPSQDEFFDRTDFEAKLNQKRMVYTRHKGYGLVVFLGAGKINEWNLDKARQLWGGAIETAHEFKVDNLALYWDNEFPTPGDSTFFIQEVVAAMVTAAYRVKDFLTKEEEPTPVVQNVYIFDPDAGENLITQIEKGQQLGESVNLTRRLAEYPSNLMTPIRFTEEVRELGERFDWEMEVLNRDELESKGFRALLAVAQGSEHEPYLAIARYTHPDAKKTAAIVGKGVTFDTGGISLKPSKKMEEMKYDMCGAAAALGALQAVSLTRLPINVVAAMPLVENMPSGKAIRPGDIIKSYSGKSIEIINTDAEGRLILADSLSYVAEQYKPDYMVDLATLTGSVLIALGRLAAAVLTTNTDMLESLEEAANISGEKIWQLPLWDDYQELLKSQIADVRNVGTKPEAGTITAAMFLKNFVPQDMLWAHFDIAGTAYNMPEKAYRPGGATGYGVRLLWHWINLLAGQ